MTCARDAQCRGRPGRLSDRGVVLLVTGVSALFVALGGLPAWAQEGERILQVDVRGAQTVAKETILARVQTRPGMLYQDAVVSEDIRRLFALGYFTDVKADVERQPDGLLLVFVVAEKPTVSGVTIEGNRKFRIQKIQEFFGVAAGSLYEARAVKEGSDRIKAEYARKGYAEVEVVSRVEPQYGNKVAVFLLLDEGPRMRVRDILVEGNTAVPDRRVRKLLKTKPRRWLFLPGRYQEQVLEEDLERVRAFYRSQGYQDVAVTSEVLRDPGGKGVLVHLTIVEGLQHRVGQVALEGVSLFPEREVLRLIKLKPGAVYSIDGLHEDLRLVKEYYGDRGYIHMDVTPEPQLDPDTKRVNLTYPIEERELVHINRIAIRGNLKTKGAVVRRELRVYPGQAFDGAKIRKSTERLENLGIFEEVSIETEPTEDPQREDLVVNVKDAKTGSVSFGGGFSSVDRLVGLIEVAQRNFDWRNWPNFTGAGQDIRFRVEAGSVRRFFDVSFTEPWIFGFPVSFGFDVYNRTRLRERNVGLAVEEERRGGGLRLGREFFDRLKVFSSYQFYRTKISDVVSEASADLKAEEGTSNTSVGSLSVAHDTRNNQFDPTKGTYVFVTGDLAGGIFAADRDFYRIQTGASAYWPHLNGLVLEARARTGFVNEYGDASAVPIFERFFGGGAGTIRGYEERDVGPHDATSGDPIGGETIILGSLEEVITLVRDERSRPIIKASVFIDVGDVYQGMSNYAETLKTGVGVGSRITTPIGPLRLDLGFPMDEVAGEKRRPRFHFNISRGF